MRKTVRSPLAITTLAALVLSPVALAQKPPLVSQADIIKQSAPSD